ncbi:unnamed protein product [Urochloa humidicola]
MLPPLQPQLPSSQHAQYYPHQDIFGAATHRQAHNMPLLGAGASTTPQMPPPPRQQLRSAQHAHYYHHQHAFGAAAAGAAAQKQAHNIPVHGAGLPTGNLRQSASSPSPSPVPVPATVNPAAAHHAPAPAAHAVKQEPYPFGATCSPPAIQSPPEEQHAAATLELAAHTQFAGCIKLTEAAPLEDIVPAPAAKDERMADANADDFDGLGALPDWNNFDLPLNDSYLFTMEEILGLSAFDETPAMEGDNSNSVGENCGQAGGSGGQHEPPAALSCY